MLKEQRSRKIYLEVLDELAYITLCKYDLNNTLLYNLDGE
jgi:hypothetical protein